MPTCTSWARSYSKHFVEDRSCYWRKMRQAALATRLGKEVNPAQKERARIILHQSSQPSRADSMEHSTLTHSLSFNMAACPQFNSIQFNFTSMFQAWLGLLDGSYQSLLSSYHSMSKRDITARKSKEVSRQQCRSTSTFHLGTVQLTQSSIKTTASASPALSLREPDATVNVFGPPPR